MGFTILATEGTAEVLRRNGIKCETVRKHFEAAEGQRTIVDIIRAGEVPMVINTPYGNSGPRVDGYEIRSAAVGLITAKARGAARLEEARAETAALRALAERVDEAATVAGDVATELGAYLTDLPSDPSELESLLLRQSELKTLTRKYAPDIAGVIAWRKKAAKRLSKIDTSAEAVEELTARIYTDFAYKSGATNVSTRVGTVMERREGVCQDFARVAIACLRSKGLAARYVSGYLATEPPPGRDRVVGAGATHAWAAVWLPGDAWLPFDPTNNKFVDERHVSVAFGRDYEDVPPLRGVYAGPHKGDHAPGVAVLDLPLEQPRDGREPGVRVGRDVHAGPRRRRQRR